MLCGRFPEGGYPKCEFRFASCRLIFFLSAAMALLSRRMFVRQTLTGAGRQAKQEIKYSQDPNASKNMTLLLKDSIRSR